MTASDGLIDEDAKADYAVVFGSKVNKDGTLSSRLAARLDRAVSLYNKDFVSVIFVSGGLGKEGYKEGSKMQEYLLKVGVPAGDVLVDNKGNTSRLTAVNFSKKVSPKSSVIVVSQFFHVPRCKLAMRQVGFEHVYGASCAHYELRDFISITREFIAYYKYLMVY